MKEVKDKIEYPNYCSDCGTPLCPNCGEHMEYIEDGDEEYYCTEDCDGCDECEEGDDQPFDEFIEEVYADGYSDGYDDGVEDAPEINCADCRRSR